MTISLESIPTFTAAEALAMAQRHYGLTGSVSALPSERDQNFLFSDTHGMGGAHGNPLVRPRLAGPRLAGPRFVLKIANSNDAPELLDFQNQGMRRVAAALEDCRVPTVLNSLTGADVTLIRNPRRATDHCIRLLSWIDGEVLARTRPRGPALYESIGAGMGKID